MPKSEVLRKRSEFQRLHENGKVFRAADVVVVLLRNECAAVRIAVVASRRVGTAVQRNRAKRMLRAAHRAVLAQGALDHFDVLLIARPDAASRTTRILQDQIQAVYAQAGLKTTDTESPRGDHRE